MKKVLSIILALCMLASATVAFGAETGNPFSDVAEDAWYHDEIVKAVKTGIINGKSETVFAPDDLLTYAEAIKLAACMNQVYLSGEVTLTPGDVWYEPFAEYCLEAGITDREYSYNESVTRAGYIEIFANALPDEAYDDINNIPDGSILDVKDNAPYAIYVYKLYRAGIVTGVDDDHNCNPDASIKRSEVAAIISRMMNKDERVEFDMDEEIIEKIYDNGYIEKDEDDDDDPANATVVYTDPNTPAEEEPTNIPPENPEFTTEVPTQTVTPDIIVVPTVPVDDIDKPVVNAPLTIHQQPEGLEAEEYGTEHKLEVVVFGGKAPYTYEWYYKERRDNITIENGDYAKDAETGTLTISVEKQNLVLGANVYCKITDSLGETVTTEAVKVYGPFSMPVETDTIVTATKEYELVGSIADGVVRKDDKVSVVRNGKIIAIGTVSDIKMFNKSLDNAIKNDYVGLMFVLEKGVRPTSGDTVIKYKEGHVIDTSDIIN